MCEAYWDLLDNNENFLQLMLFPGELLALVLMMPLLYWFYTKQFFLLGH